MEVLLVSAELSPYAAVGPAGDYVAGLGRALCQMGHGVTLVMPRLKGIEAAGVMVARRLTPLALGPDENVTLYDGQLPSGVRLVLFEAAALPSCESVLPEQGPPTQEDWPRLAVLCRAAAAFAQQRAQQGSGFDVIHLHGWATAATAALTPLPTVFTFYDATEQALLTEEAFQGFGVPEDQRKAFALGGKYSLLKGGLLLSRSVATFSAHLAEQANNVEFAGALGGSLSAAGVELFGIPAGLDYAVYNPATDTAIPTRYDVEGSRVKGSCKSAVCRDLQLDISPDVPLVVFAQPLNSASGADLVAAAVAPLCKAPLQLIVAGTGEASLKKLLSSARLAKLANFRAVDRLAPDFERRLLSAADIALYPAREPGLGSPLRVAQRYGAVPVALSSAVARDIVVDCPAELQTGTGFLFDEATSDALRGGVERAVAAHGSAGWAMLRRRVMRLDLGWERSAQRYFQLYKSALTNAQPLYAV